jgi:hypothetical protein
MSHKQQTNTLREKCKCCIIVNIVIERQGLTEVEYTNIETHQDFMAPAA